MNTVREFGVKREKEERRDGGCAVVFDPASQKFAVGEKSNGGFLMLFGGGVGAQEDIQEGTLREVSEESGLYDFLYVEKIDEVLAHYHNSLRNVNRVTLVTCFLVILNSTNVKEVQHEEHEKFRLSWATSEAIVLNWKKGNKNSDVDHWLYFFDKALQKITALGYDAIKQPAS